MTKYMSLKNETNVYQNEKNIGYNLLVIKA